MLTGLLLFLLTANAQNWAWSGAVTSSSAVVVARYPAGQLARIVVSRTPGFQALEAQSEVSLSPLRFEVSGLQANTTYYAGARVEGEPLPSVVSRFRTLPGEESFPFRFLIGACAQTGSSSLVFATMLDEEDASFMLHMGDLHYENIASNSPSLFREAYDAVMASPRQQALYLSLPVVYMWDDHDFGPNNADSTSASRPAALEVYRELVPHYPLASARSDTAVHQAFSVGSALFIISDVRSNRSPEGMPDSPQKTMLGKEQKEWTKAQLTRGLNHSIVFWMVGVPWLSDSDDGWGSYDTERRELQAHIDELLDLNLVVLAGDMHGLALDDGTALGYPVIIGGSLDRPGSIKGGPYSHGCKPGPRQYGVIDVDGACFRVSLKSPLPVNGAPSSIVWDSCRPEPAENPTCVLPLNAGIIAAIVIGCLLLAMVIALILAYTVRCCC